MFIIANNIKDSNEYKCLVDTLTSSIVPLYGGEEELESVRGLIKWTNGK